jgi:hypothetical protein
MRTSASLRGLVAALIVAAAPTAWAGQLEDSPLTAWHVKKGSPGSKAEGGNIVVRIYSPVVWDGVGREVSEVRVEIDALVPFKHVEGGLQLRINYDDWLEEVVEGVIPKNTKSYEIVYRPKWSKGRIVKSFDLHHGQTGSELRIRRFRMAVERTAVVLTSSAFGAAQLHAGENLRNNILVMRWDDDFKKRPYLTNFKAGRLRVLAAKTGGGPTFKNDLFVKALDARGNSLKSWSKPLDANVQPLEFVLTGVDMKKVDRIVFEPSGSGCHMAIRQIIVGGAP